LDGADWGILGPLLDRGELPNLAELCERGASGPLQSTFPPITTSGWVALATGLDPGGTGILQFRRFDFRRFDGYDSHMVDSSDVQGRTWLERMPGDSVSCVGLPLTYPAFQIPGVLVAGQPRPHLDKTPVVPESWRVRLPEWPLLPEGSHHHRSLRGAEFCQRWDRHHVELTRALLRQRDDELTLCVLSGTDHAAHLFWGDHRAGHPLGAALRAQYRLADELIGDLLAEVDADTDVLVVSDHGFGDAPRWTFALGRWLRENGWLTLKPADNSSSSSLLRSVREMVPDDLWHGVRTRVPERLLGALFKASLPSSRIDGASTRAFRVQIYPGYEGLCINLQGRQHEGIVPATQRSQQLDRLVEELRGIELRVPGTSTGPAGRLRLWRREELFSGSYLEELPDLLVEFPPGWRGSEGLDDGPLCAPVSAAELQREPGEHQRDGILIAAGPSFRSLSEPMGSGSEAGARLVDIAPTLCRLLGFEVPQEFVGRSLNELLEPASRGAQPPFRRLRAPEDSGSDAPAVGKLSPSQRDEIERGLRDLGYL